MKSDDYLLEIKARLITSPVIAEIELVVEEWALVDQGYFRARLKLSNGDFLEVAEYFVIDGELLDTRRYRYQWMDSEQASLRRRWDNVEHFPELPNFPHHIHSGDEPPVPGRKMSILMLIDLLESELD
jgi:hypothetical protein